MSEELDQLRDRLAALEDEVAALRSQGLRRSVRQRSATYIGSLPWYDIALGPDASRGEVRGYARGIIAIGDVATGVVAFGGVARGFLAIGGVALGAIALGGCAVGVLVGIGGLAIGCLAIGGGAIGGVAFGGGAIGLYAVGGGTVGKYVINGVEQHPEAVRFLKEWVPWIARGFIPPAR